MTPYLYLKKDRLEEIRHRDRKKKKIIAGSFLLTGFILIFSTVFPIIKYELFLERRFFKIGAEEKIISPLVLAEEDSSSEKVDFSLLSNWFPVDKEFTRLMNKQPATEITDYSLSIPNLNISDAHVNIGGNDLDKSLIHFGGSALPGELGNAVVFGHSVLPQFFNPKNYTTIFSTLPTLEEGDEIFINYDGIVYKYKVESMIATKPEDLMSVLTQDTHDSFLTLITCVPPGTYWKRLAVKARLTKI